MEAKDTVVHADGCTTNLGVIGATCNCGAEIQAEISFKAGVEIGFAKGVISRVNELSLLNEDEMEELNTQAKVYLDAVKQAGIRLVVEFVNNLIIGIEGCKFEERLDGDKGCIVLDMNENQWQAKLKEWKIELP